MTQPEHSAVYEEFYILCSIQLPQPPDLLTNLVRLLPALLNHWRLGKKDPIYVVLPDRFYIYIFTNIGKI